MYQNYAWFVQKSGPPNETWRMVNSLVEVQSQHRKVEEPRCPDDLFFEWGVTGSSHRSLPVKMDALSRMLFPLDMWMADMKAGPIYVYGRMNMFEPALYHWRKTRNRGDRPQMLDLLEALVLPGAVPTLHDRNNVDRGFACWLTGDACLQPLDFFQQIQPTLPSQ